MLATAFHEAGHAVVSIHLGLPVSEVSIVAAADSNGQFRHPPPMLVDLGEGAGLGRRQKRVARQMIIASFSGLAAQRLVEPDASESVAATDVANAWWLSRTYFVFPRYFEYVDDEYHERYMLRLCREAERIVARQRKAIEELAFVLIRRRTLTGDEAVLVVEPHLVS